MARLTVKPSYKKYPQKQKIWFAGEIAERGCYVCRHCNTETLMENGNTLPLCPSCYGRRFSQL